MEKSLYTKLGVLVKKTFRIKDFSILKKNIKRGIGKLIYRRKYDVQDLIGLMKKMGMGKGSVVCVHSSMKEFYNFKGTAEELIEAILLEIGQDGTLMMPAFPSKDLVKKEDYIFDKLNDKTGAGYLAESFRKFPGVKRSINVQHSVCAIGKYADFLLNDHHRCHDCWDNDSPWMRLCELNGLVFNLGLPRSYMGTFHHCIESLLQFEHPYWAQFFQYKKKYKYYDDNRNILEYETYETGEIDRRTYKRKVTKYFTKDDWEIQRISNLEVKVYKTKSCFPKMVELARKGISLYYVPSTKGYTFK